MSNVVQFRKKETLAEVLEQAVKENPEAHSGIVILFDGDENAMTIYYKADGLQQSYAGARLLYRSVRDGES